MKWRTLHEMHSGVIGRSILIISVATPIAYMMDFGLKFNKYYISLIGSLIILVSYFFTTIFCPKLIKKHGTSHDFADNILDVNKKKALDQIFEFKYLELKKNKIVYGMNSDFCHVSQFDNITKYIEEFGEKAAIRNMSIIKYNMIDESLWLIRYLLILFLFFGTFFLYAPIILSIYKVLSGGLT